VEIWLMRFHVSHGLNSELSKTRKCGPQILIIFPGWGSVVTLCHVEHFDLDF
jgi:hypothetical protein